MVLLPVLLAAVVASPAAAAAVGDHSVIAISTSGLMHLDSNGALLAWRPEVFQWWQAWHVATNPRNGTICWVSAPEDQGVTAVVRCAQVASLNQTWDLPQPRGLRVNKADALAFDWLNENWYLTESRVNYVCSYMFDRCVRLGKSGGNVRFFAAYDIPNRLLFRITTNTTGPYRLEVLNLDGTGRRILPTNLTYPAGLAVDPVHQNVYIVDNNDSFWNKGIFRVNYAGEGKRLVTRRDVGFSHSWRRSIDVVNDDIVVSWDDQKVVSRVSASDGKVKDLVAGAVSGETVPALAKVEGLLAVRIFSPETQPEVANQCSDAGCQHLCIPTMVNGTAGASCFCPEGEELVDLTCQKVYPAYAVVVGPGSLQVVDLQTDKLTEILTDLTDATKVDFFWLGGEEFLLFWVDDGSLFSGRWLPGAVVSDVRRLVQASEKLRVLEVAVDWVQRNLIWMEIDPSKSKYDKSLTFKIASFDGTYVRTLANEYWKEQQALVITGYGRLFTYLQHSWDENEFKTLDMNGESSFQGFGYSSAEFLTSLPAEIAVDLSLAVTTWQHRIFWINNITNSVEVIWKESTFGSYNHAPQLLTHPSLAHAGGLSVLDTRLFWTDRVTGQLWTANSETGGSVRALPVETRGGAVRVLHPWLQPANPRPVCDEQRNGCSHFCIQVLVDWERAGQCACPDGQTLGDDQKTCQ